MIPKTTQRISKGSSIRNSAPNLLNLAKAGSSVAALRAKREGGSPCGSAPKAQTGTVTSKLSKTAAYGENSAAGKLRQPLQDCNRNTKLQISKDSRDRSKDAVCGKQGNGLPDQPRSANQRQTKDPVTYNNSKESPAHDRAKTPLTNATGALKRPKPKAESLKGTNAPARGSTYKICESSIEDRTSTKPTVVAKSNGRTVKSRTGRGASPRSRKEPLPAPEGVHTNGVQPLISNPLKSSANDHAPNAVKAMWVDPEPQLQVPSEAQKGQISSRARNLSLEQPGVHIVPNNKERPDESIEDFEKQVVAYSDHDGFPPIQKKTSVDHIPIAPLQPGQENRPGVSQQSAILLSDEYSSTPSDRGGSPKQTGTPAARDSRGPRPTMKAPRTPTILQSSPPVEDVRISKTPGTSLTATSRKANIISFDDTGPRNQGSILMKTAVGSAWVSRTEKSSSPQWATQTPGAGSSRVSVSGRCNRKPPATSSVAASLRTSRTKCSSHSANVASTVGEALAGFFTEKHTHVPSLRKAPPSARASEMSKAGQGQQMSYSSDAPANFDDHEDAIMVNGVAEQKQPIRTESQLAMPPPPPKDSKAGKLQPPPPLARSKPLEMRDRTNDDASLSSSKKRSVMTQDGEQPFPKRVKPTTELSDSKFSAVPGDVTFTEGYDNSGPTTMFAPNTTKAPLRKPTRNPSQGNVDCHGSPVPRGFEVPANSTALEVYSQQANLSSDRLITQQTSKGRSQRATKQNVDAYSLDQHVLPPSHQPEVMSSNTKIRPASPQEDSQAITGVAIRRVESNSLVIRDVAAPNTDPFIGSESARKEPSKTRPFSTFTQKLFEQAGEAGADLGQQAGGRNRPPVIDQAPKKHSTKRLPSWSSDDSNNTNASAETTDTMRDIGIWRNALQPYQVNLFDELVTVSHRLMRSLIDRETAAREVVEDYRSRGSRLVAQMEETHALLYTEHMGRLTQRKKKLRKELGKCNDQLQEMVTTVKAASHERQERLQRRSNEVAELRKLLDDWR